MDTDANNKDIEYTTYLDERRLLIEAEQKGAQQFDKAILTLAGGALAISITFIKNIAPYPKVETIYLLKGAWFAFILSLLSTLCSFLTSQSACRKQRDIIESEESHNEKNKYASCTKWLNIISIISFIFGIFFLSIFCIENIPIK